MCKLKTALVALCMVLVLFTTNVVSAQSPTPPRSPIGQGQPPQGQPPNGQSMPEEWSGVVQSVSSSTLIVARASGDTFTATLATTATVQLMTSGTTGSVSDIAAGNSVSIMGSKTSSTAVMAYQVMVEPSGSRVAGQVNAVSGATITLATPQNTVAVVTTSTTTFLKGKEAGSLADVTVDAFVVAYGTLGTDGSLTATYVMVNTGGGPAPDGQGGAPQGNGGTYPAPGANGGTPPPPPSK